jgi:hypothetical protein
MPAATKTATHFPESSFISVFSGWAQQGVQGFFATQRMLLDLAMRQNANVMHALRRQFSDPQNSPTAIFSQVAGETMENFIEGQKILLDLGKHQNEILMNGVKERVGDWPEAHAMADLMRRSVDTFIHMQEQFLNLAGKETHTWMQAAKTGKACQPEHLVNLAREGMEDFVKAQKQFLGVMAEATAEATGGKKSNGAKKMKKTELADLARQATESLIAAQKKLVDVAGKQMNSHVKAAGKGLEMLPQFPFLPLAELTREGVKSYVDAQKTLMDMMVKPGTAHRQERHKNPVRAKKQAAAAAA